MNRIFVWCVQLLGWMAHATGLSYEQVNVLLFCIVWPLVTLVLMGIVVLQRMELARERADRALWGELMGYDKLKGVANGEKKEGGCCCGECGGEGRKYESEGVKTVMY